MLQVWCEDDQDSLGLAHSRFTQLFDAFTIEVLRACSSVKRAAELLGIDWSSAHTNMKCAVDRGLKNRVADKFTSLIWMRRVSVRGTNTLRSCPISITSACLKWSKNSQLNRATNSGNHCLKPSEKLCVRLPWTLWKFGSQVRARC